MTDNIRRLRWDPSCMLAAVLSPLRKKACLLLYLLVSWGPIAIFFLLGLWVFRVGFFRFVFVRSFARCWLSLTGSYSYGLDFPGVVFERRHRSGFAWRGFMCIHHRYLPLSMPFALVGSQMGLHQRKCCFSVFGIGHPVSSFACLLNRDSSWNHGLVVIQLKVCE